MPEADDATVQVDLVVDFPYYGNFFPKLFISTNGLISFMSAISSYQPQTFPTSYGVPLIAPFWTDMNNGAAADGWIFYRQTSEASLLYDIDIFLRRNVDFLPRTYRSVWALIITFLNQPPFSYPTSPYPRNSFQCLLVTDGLRSYVIFLYADINFGDGYAGSATIGFDSGYDHSYDVFQSPSEALEADERSNVGVPGAFVHEVSSADFSPASTSNCSSISKVLVAPAVVNFMGGEILSLRSQDVCFDQSQSIKCFFTRANHNDVHPRRLSSQARFVDGQQAVCPLPKMLKGAGKYTLMVDNGRNITMSTSIIVAADDSGIVAPLGTALEGQSHVRPRCLVEKRGGHIAFSWDPSIFLPGTAAVDLSMFVYDFDQDTFVQQVVSIGLDNSGSHLVHAANISHIDMTRESVVYFEVLPQESPLNHYNTSYVAEYASILQSNTSATFSFSFLLAYPFAALRSTYVCTILEDHGSFKALSPEVDEVYSEEVYVAGYSMSEHYVDEYTYSFGNLFRCPCTQAQITAAQWLVEPYCSSPSSCTSYYPGSTICYRQTQPSVDGSTNQCCYSSNGQINTSPEGGGTADRWHYKHRNYKGLLYHYRYDLIPFEQLRIEYLPVYLNMRPIESNCVRAIRRPTFTFGDPHLVTFDGLRYTFNAVGEFHHLIDHHRSIVNMQSRLTEVGSSGGSIISAIAISELGTYGPFPRVQVTIVGSQFLVRVDGEIQEFFSTVPSIDVGNMVVMVMNTTTFDDISISLPGVVDVILKLKANGIYLQMNIDEAMQTQTRGLAGVYNDDPEDDFTTCNGTVLSSNSSAVDIHGEFGMSWRVQNESESLFFYAAATPFEYYFNANFTPNFIELPFDSSTNGSCTGSNLTAAQKLCNCQLECMYDFQTTGDETFAKATGETVTEVAEEEQRASVVVVACDMPSPPANGSYSASGLLPGNTLQLKCGKAFRAVNNQTAVCSETGEWEPIDIGYCEAIIYPSGAPTVVPSTTEYLTVMPSAAETGTQEEESFNDPTRIPSQRSPTVSPTASPDASPTASPTTVQVATKSDGGDGRIATPLLLALVILSAFILLLLLFLLLRYYNRSNKVQQALNENPDVARDPDPVNSLAPAFANKVAPVSDNLDDPTDGSVSLDNMERERRGEV